MRGRVPYIAPGTTARQFAVLDRQGAGDVQRVGDITELVDVLRRVGYDLARVNSGLGR